MTPEQDRPLAEKNPDAQPEPASTVQSTVPFEHTVGGKAKAHKDLSLVQQVLSPPAAEDEIGRLEHYRILEVLGSGGMGIVLKARDMRLKRLAAIKVLNPALAAIAAARQRFVREARAMAAIEHDHVVTIYQVGQGDVPYLAMQLLVGETLQSRLQRDHKLPFADVLHIGRQMAEGLAAAHAAGLIHRDIKPGNIFLEHTAAAPVCVKILDFGLARAASQQTRISEPGALLGTPQYMSPEQARGAELDARSDLFSLAAVVYRSATGRVPFHGASVPILLQAIEHEVPVPPRDLAPELPQEFSDLIVRLLAKKPEKRPQSAEEVATIFQQLEDEQRTQTLPVKAKRRSRRWLVAAALLLIAVGGSLAYLMRPTADPVNRACPDITFPSGLLLGFEENRGQADGQVSHLLRADGYTAFLTAQGVVLATAVSSERMQFGNSSPTPKVSGQTQLVGKANYFIGSDAAKWITDIATYRQVRCQQVYNGIDVQYGSDDRKLCFALVLSPAVDALQIRLKFPDSPGLRIDEKGQLVISSQLSQPAPAIYQEIAQTRRPVNGRYVLAGPNEVRFEIGDYDHSNHLMIEASMVAAPTDVDERDAARRLALDAAGNLHMTSAVAAAEFPPAPGKPATNKHIQVVKLNGSGSEVLYSSYLGGNGNAWAADLAVGPSGDVFVIGNGDGAWPNSFPTTAGSLQTFNESLSFMLVFRLNSSGNALVYSALPDSPGIETATGMAVDGANNCYLTGSASVPGSALTPTRGAFQIQTSGISDAFAMKISAKGDQVLYFTYLGGSGADQGVAIAVDSSNNTYITGTTESGNFPVASPHDASLGGKKDCFITKINPAASVVMYSTFLGGSAEDWPARISLDEGRNVFVAGTTQSADFTTGKGSYRAPSFGGASDIFVSKFDSRGAAMVWSALLGSPGADVAQGLALDKSGRAYVTGWTDSKLFPNAKPVQAPAANRDAVVCVLNAKGTDLELATHLGGAAADAGSALALDAANNIFVAGTSSSPDFLTGKYLLAKLYGGAGGAAFIQKIDALAATLEIDKGPLTEIQQLTVAGKTTGSFSLTFKGVSTEKIVLDGAGPANAAKLQAALNSLTLIGGAGGSVTVANPQPNVYTISFGGSLLGADVPQITTAFADPGTNVTVTTITQAATLIAGPNSIPGISLTESGGNTTVTEGAATDTYSIVLKSAPTANVNIMLDPGNQVAVNPAKLIFTPANWNIAQRMTVTAVDDALVEGPHTGIINHTSTSVDPAYNGLAIGRTTVNIVDNDLR